MTRVVIHQSETGKIVIYVDDGATVFSPNDGPVLTLTPFQAREMYAALGAAISASERFGLRKGFGIGDEECG